MEIMPAPKEGEADRRPRAKALGLMASMSIAIGEVRAAEGYLLELLAWCAFADIDHREGELVPKDE